MYNQDNYNKSTFINKLDCAIRYRYDSPQNNTDNKRNRAFYDDFRRKYPDSDISQSVRSWRSFSKNNKKRLPSVKQLMQICDILDCDIDYFLTPQREFKKEIACFSSISGLNYKATENMAKLNKDNTYASILNRQCLNSLLSNTQNIDIINTIAHLIYTADTDEIDSIETTYNVNSTENEQEFADRIADADFNFLLKYGEFLYLCPHQDNIHLSYLGMDLIKKLELLRQSHKTLRKEYKGNIEIHLDYDTYIEKDNADKIFEWYENKDNKELANPNVSISFIEYQ